MSLRNLRAEADQNPASTTELLRRMRTLIEAETAWLEEQTYKSVEHNEAFSAKLSNMVAQMDKLVRLMVIWGKSEMARVKTLTREQEVEELTTAILDRATVKELVLVARKLRRVAREEARKAGGQELETEADE